MMYMSINLKNFDIYLWYVDAIDILAIEGRYYVQS